MHYRFCGDIPESPLRCAESPDTAPLVERRSSGAPPNQRSPKVYAAYCASPTRAHRASPTRVSNRVSNGVCPAGALWPSALGRKTRRSAPSLLFYFCGGERGGQPREHSARGRTVQTEEQRSRSRGMGGRARAARLPQNILQHSLSTLHCILHCILHLDSRRKCAAASRLQGAHHAFSTSRRLLWLCVALYCAVSPARVPRRAVIPDSRSVSCKCGCTAFVPALICNRASSPSPRLCVSTASPTHSVAHNAPCGLAVTPPPLLLCSALAPVPWPLVILSFATALSFGGSRYIKVARSWYYCRLSLVPFILYLLEYNNNTLYLNTTIH